MTSFPSPSASDAALLLIDIQTGIVDNSHTNPGKQVRLAAGTAVKVAKLLTVPTFVSLVPAGGKAPEAVDELEGLPTFTRHFAGAFNQPEIREAIAATGRKVIGIGGIVSEIAVLQGTLTAIREGYTVHVLVDCCGGLTERTEQAVFRQMEAAGAVLSSVASFFTTLQGDFSTPEGGQVLKTLHGLMAKEK